MPKVKCPNQHEYDNSRDTRCPFCEIPDLKDAYESRPRSEFRGSPQTPKPRHPITTIVWGDATEAAVRERPVLGDDPVVGWLIAYDGPCKGADFRIHNGINSIGRESTNRIVVPDPQVSGTEQAFVIYDPRSTKFALRSGNQIQFPYIRDVQTTGGQDEWKPVWGHEQLEPYDEIMIGGSKFVFVPLCGERFKWL